jgi:hypothetical protein
MRTSALLLCLARLRFNRSTTTIPSHYGGRLGAGWGLSRRFDRLAIFVAIRRFPDMGATDSRSLRSNIYVRMQHFDRRHTSFPVRRFLGDVRRVFLERLSSALHGTLGSYLRDALQEDSANAMASCSYLLCYF